MKQFLSNYWVPRINAVNSRPVNSVQSFLGEGADYVTYNKIEDSNSFSLAVTNSYQYLLSLCFDINRFNCAMVESLSSVQQNALLAKSLSWSLIKIYYSSFYAAQSLMRCFGTSFTYIDPLILSKINLIHNAYHGETAKIGSGYYSIQFISSTNELIFKRLNLSSGSHESFWQAFSNKINLMSNDLLSIGSTESIQAGSRLIDLYQKMSNCRLSSIRNDLNYQHQYGVWYPYRNYEKYYNSLLSEIEKWKNDLSNISIGNTENKQLLLFTRIIIFICCLCRENYMEMNRRCPNGKSFLNYQTLPLNQLLNLS